MFLYQQQEVPPLQPIIRIKQSQKEPTTQHWKHLVATIQILKPQPVKLQGKRTVKCQYVFYKAQCPQIGMLYFQQNCLMTKKTLFVNYYSKQQITCIKTYSKIKPSSQFENQNKGNPQSNEEILLCIGFHDGTVVLYTIINQVAKYDSATYAHLINKIAQLKAKVIQPVTDIQIYYPNSSTLSPIWLFVCKLTLIVLFKQPLTEPVEVNLRVKRKDNKILGKLSIHVEYDSWQPKLYIFNQMTGIICYLLPSLEQGILVNDSTVSINSVNFSYHEPQNIKQGKLKKNLISNNADNSSHQNQNKQQLNGEKEKETEKDKKVTQDVLITGASDDTLNFIYYNDQKVVKYRGMKNYPYTIQLDGVQIQNNRQSTIPRVWIGCLDGSLYYFKVKSYPQQITSPTGTDYKLIDKNLCYGKKLCQNGIRHLKICGKLLIVLDTEANIIIYDIYI